MFEILTRMRKTGQLATVNAEKRETYDRTLENSDVGDMTKLSLVLDQEIRCWMDGSSSMLLFHSGD